MSLRPHRYQNQKLRAQIHPHRGAAPFADFHNFASAWQSSLDFRSKSMFLKSSDVKREGWFNSRPYLNAGVPLCRVPSEGIYQVSPGNKECQ